MDHRWIRAIAVLPRWLFLSTGTADGNKLQAARLHLLLNVPLGKEQDELHTVGQQDGFRDVKVQVIANRPLGGMQGLLEESATWVGVILEPFHTLL